MSSIEEEMRGSRKDCMVIVSAALEAALDAAFVAQARQVLSSPLRLHSSPPQSLIFRVNSNFHLASQSWINLVTAAWS